MKELTIYLLAVMAVLLCGQRGYAQNAVDEKKFEVSAQFTTLSISDPNSFSISNPNSPQERTEAGFGGRFGYNLSKYFALEAEVNFFPKNFSQVRTDFTGGRVTQGLLGLKAGIHRKKVGFFGKIRPSFVSSGNAVRDRFLNEAGNDPNNPFSFKPVRSTQMALAIMKRCFATTDENVIGVV